MGCKTRGNPSILIDNLLIDIGCGTVKQLGKLDIETKSIKYILISHFHSDHFADIGHFLVTRYLRKEMNNTIKIIGPVGLEKRIKDFLKIAEHQEILLEGIEIVELEENETYNLDKFKIKPLSLNHGNLKPVFGYIVKAENKKIGYTCDTASCTNFEKICTEVDYLIGDANDIENTANHMGLNDFTNYAKNYSNCRFYAIHRGDYEERNQYVNFPEDGDSITI